MPPITSTSRFNQIQTITVTFLFILGILAKAQLDENERLEKYHERNYTFPIPKHDYVPDTPGWRRLMERRINQVEMIKDDDERYNGWANVITSAIAAPNFTEHGWGLTRAPEGILNELKKSLHDGLEKAKPEGGTYPIFGEKPLFIRQGTLSRKVLRELRPMHEDWSGVQLQHSQAYGLRVYRNSSMLLMHIDRPLTHIISSILHIDHSEDSEPWPIVIEDFQGNTNEVILESGDMLFYESSKCLHGRPHTFNGSWYSSIFIHYRPVGWEELDLDMERHYAIPAHWYKQSPPKPDLEEVRVVESALTESECVDGWCALKESVKWNVRGEEGFVISTGNARTRVTNDENSPLFMKSKQEPTVDSLDEL